MKLILQISMIASLLLGSVHADDVMSAYAKEYAFLKAQKTELAARLEKEKKEQDAQVAKLNREVTGLQDQYISATRSIDSLELDVKKSSENLDSAAGNKEIVASVAIQVKAALSEYGSPIKDETLSDIAVIEHAFKKSSKLYQELSSIRKVSGEFFLLDGSSVTGDIVKIGNVAAYGVSSKGSGALAPAGNGAFKLWIQQGPLSEVKMLADGKKPQELNMYIYETLDKDVDYPKEKTIKETLDMGGPIAYFIVALGVLGLFLLLYKVRVLVKAGSNVNKIKQIVVEKLQTGKGDEALDAIHSYEGAVARVMKATLRNIKSDREHIEDIITENIINESGAIDQYGNFILVLAAVAPLVGLLGTVTGMITTFDEIASFGTSDPKLLSGGISEALVNTELGLAVAIPLLLGGNLLSGWANTIKDTMEQSALHVVNVYKKHKVQ